MNLQRLVKDFYRSAAADAARSDALLDSIIAEAPLHQRFMNTLSMLEHMGSYKILATQHGRGIDQATLKHVTEEARHAWFFKRQAERLAGRALDYSPAVLLAPSAAWMYFQKVEAGVVRQFGNERPLKIYLATSLVIEFRAIWFYERYQQALDRAGFPLSLRKLTGEEEVHLRDMAERLVTAGDCQDRDWPPLLAAETRLYRRLLAGLERAAGCAVSAAA